MCRNQSEVTTILNDCEDEDGLDGRAFEEGIPNLARLRLAVNYNQKQVRRGPSQGYWAPTNLNAYEDAQKRHFASHVYVAHKI